MALKRVRELTEDFHAQLQSATKALEDREDQLNEERHQLKKEKREMAAFAERSDSDIVEINVGGEVMTTTRGTLTLAKGTLLEAIFSGRWEESLKPDGAGRVFLDFSPTPFKALLSFLRALRDAKPGRRVAPPVVPPEHKEEYETIVSFLNLGEFLAEDALVCAQSTGGTCDGSIQCNGGVLRGGNGSHRCAVGRVSLLGEGASRNKAAWKVTVSALAGWFCAGVISHSSPGNNSFYEPTCWAWGSGVFLAGVGASGHGGWSGWKQGDVAIFQLDVSKGLRMFLRRSRQVYHIMQGVSTDVMMQARVHLNFHERGTEVEVSEATAEDLAEAKF